MGFSMRPEGSISKENLPSRGELNQKIYDLQKELKNKIKEAKLQTFLDEEKYTEIINELQSRGSKDYKELIALTDEIIRLEEIVEKREKDKNEISKKIKKYEKAISSVLSATVKERYNLYIDNLKLNLRKYEEDSTKVNAEKSLEDIKSHIENTTKILDTVLSANNVLKEENEGLKTDNQNLKKNNAQLQSQTRGYQSLYERSKEKHAKSTQLNTRFAAENKQLRDLNAGLLEESLRQELDLHGPRGLVAAKDQEIAKAKEKQQKASARIVAFKEDLAKAEEIAVEAKEAQAKAEADQKAMQEEAVNFDLYNETFKIIREEFDKHYDKYILISSKNEKDHKVANTSLGMYIAVKKAKKVSKQDAEAENGYNKIIERVIERYDEMMAKASENSKKKLGEDIKLTDISTSESKKVVERIIDLNSSKIKKNVTTLSLVAGILALTSLAGAGFGVYQQDKKVEAQKGEAKNKAYAVVVEGVEEFESIANSLETANTHSEKLSQKQTEGAIETLSVTQSNSYEESYNAILNAKEIADSIVVLDENGTIVGGDLGEAFVNYQNAIDKSNKKDADEYKSQIEDYVAVLGQYAQESQENYLNMIQVSGYTVDQLSDKVKDMEEDIAKKDEIIESFETREISELNTDTQTYQKFKKAFVSGKGNIKNIRIVYQASNGIVTITYDEVNGKGLEIKDNIENHTITAGLADENTILGEITEIIEATAEAEM